MLVFNEKNLCMFYEKNCDKITNCPKSRVNKSKRSKEQI